VNDTPPDFKKSRRAKAPRAVDLSKLDRLPPHSIEAEQGIIGCALLSPNDSLGICVQKLKRGADFFYDLRHQALYELLVTMYDEKKPIDLITVQQVLKDKNQLEAVGGIAYLTSLQDAVPSAANLGYYVEIIREKYLLRRVIQSCTAVVGRVYEHEGEVDALLDEIEREVLNISQDRVEAESLNIKELIRAAITTIEECHERQGTLSGLATGLGDFDKMTSGLHGGEMIVIAARPSMGKTSLAMNIVEHVAVELKIPVGVFSLEMTAASLVLRMLASRAQVNLKDLREGYLREGDFPKITNAAMAIQNAPLYIDDAAGLSILQLRAKARRMWQQHGIKLFVIDYLQLLNSTSRRAENRQQEIADISNGVKALAKELDVPVIVLAQLNRELEKDKTRKPRLSDLRESGSIEQDADLVALLYKADKDADEDAVREAPTLNVNLLIAKQRNGPTGDVALSFNKGYTRFFPRTKFEPEDAQ
jgi:replicative DNA helicase